MQLKKSFHGGSQRRVLSWFQSEKINKTEYKSEPQPSHLHSITGPNGYMF